MVYLKVLSNNNNKSLNSLEDSILDSAAISDGNAAPFVVRYVSSAAAEDLLAHDRLLAAISFGSQHDNHPEDPRRLAVGLEELGDSETVEAWFSREPVKSGREGSLSFSFNQQLIFGHMLLDEDEFQDLAGLGRVGYQRMVTFLSERGYPHVLRAWNYFPAITELEHRTERYQAFCAGRYDALISSKSCEGKLPAASAIGSHCSGGLIYFIAARAPGTQVENPRQVSAFKYPKQYGKRSPSFSRAISMDWGEDHHVYVSGTASVVGHETKHLDDLQKQLDETVQNLDAVMANASTSTSKTATDLSLLKVYVRHKDDFLPIKERLGAALPRDVPTVFLHGDICRKELLLEIEGLYLSNEIV